MDRIFTAVGLDTEVHLDVIIVGLEVPGEFLVVHVAVITTAGVVSQFKDRFYSLNLVSISILYDN